MPDPTNNPETPHPPNCTHCESCGQLANDNERTPWIFWANLPPGSDLAVQLGLVKPEPCPDCHGTGQKPQPDNCPHCPDGHTPFDGGSHPWNVHLSPDRDSDGQPTHLVVMRSAGEHCAQSDADALYELINGRKP